MIKLTNLKSVYNFGDNKLISTLKKYNLHIILPIIFTIIIFVILYFTIFLPKKHNNNNNNDNDDDDDDNDDDHSHVTDKCCQKVIESTDRINKKRSNLDPKTAMNIINTGRQSVNFPKLKWDKDLAEQAQLYADYLATEAQDYIDNVDNVDTGPPTKIHSDAITNTFKHGYIDADNKRRPLYPTKKNPAAKYPEKFGQNLAMGTKNTDSGSVSTLTKLWLKECLNCDNDDYCESGKTSQQVGHYTQSIWKNSKAIGCGLAQNKGDNFLVCNFNPPGNILAQSNKDTYYKDNVPHGC